jgi:peptidoglycan DL-endopeptidase CwlO
MANLVKASDAKLQGLRRSYVTASQLPKVGNSGIPPTATEGYPFFNLEEESAMKKLSSALLALLILLSMFSITASADTGAVSKLVVKSSVSFRDQPSTSSKVMRYLKAGEQVTVLRAVNSYWYQVVDQKGQAGYVSSGERYVEPYSNAITVAGVNFRTGPTTNASRIRFLSSGEELLVLEKFNSYWYKAKDKNGTIGYISTSSKYIEVDTSIFPPILPLQDQIEGMIEAAAQYLGTPYEFGSTRFEPSSFDCSDLVQQAIRDATGIVIPGDSRAQGDYVKAMGPAITDWQQLKRGDLMFFMSYAGPTAASYANIDKSSETITHVAIYLGEGNILHTYSQESGGVRFDTIAGKQWENRFLFGGSVFN